MVSTKIQMALGAGSGSPALEVFPVPIEAQRAPSSNDEAPLGQQWFDKSQNPPVEYTFDGSNWNVGGNAYATTTTPGIVTLSGDVVADAASTTKVPYVAAIKTYVDGIAIAGSPVSTTTVAGIGQLATDAEAVAGTASTGALALFVTPSNLSPVFAEPPAIGGTTPAAATVTDFTASGTISLDSTAASHFTLTGAVDLLLNSTAGSVDISGGKAAADAITIQAASGGIDMDSALLTSITSSRNNAQAILVEATAGGVDILASGASAGEDIDIIATGSSVNITSTESAADSIVITSTAGGIDILASGASAGEDIDITATGSSINLTSTENAALSIYLHADGGASETIRLRSDQGTGADSIDLLSDVGGVTITGGVASADAINIVASDAAGGIDVDAGTAGFALDTTGAIVETSTKNAAASIYLRANGGTSETIKIHADQGTGVASLDLLSDVGGITLTAGVASADAINLVTSNAAGGIDIDSGTAGFIVDTTGAISLDSAAASNFTVTGAFDLSLISSAGSVNVTAGEDAADAIVLSAGAGGIDILATGAAGQDIDIVNTGGSVNVTATEDAADAIYIRANAGTSEAIKIHSDQGTGVASINILSDDGGITLRSTALASADAINLEAAAGGIDMDAALLLSLTSTRDNAQAILVEATAGGIDILASGAAAGEDIDIVATGSSVNITSTESAADSIVITSTAGGIDILASGAAAGEDIDIVATGSSINITATEAAANAIVLTASDASGGIDLTTGGGSVDISSGGSVTMVAGTDSQAGDTCTVNKNVFAATYTGFTTAAGSSQVFNVTNSVVTTTSQVLLALYNEGSNDAQMTIQRVKRTAGQLQVTAKNNGASALNGNVTITGWIIG